MPQTTKKITKATRSSSTRSKGAKTKNRVAKPKIATRPKLVSAQAKKGDSSKLLISLSTDKASAHVVNLKNPNQKIFNSDYVFAAPKNYPLNPMPPAPKRLPKSSANKLTSGINFMSGGSFSNKAVQNFNTEVKKIQSTYPTAIQATAEISNPLVSGEIEDIFAPPTKNSGPISARIVPKNWAKSLAVFVLTALVLIMPLQAFTYYQDLQQTKDQILLVTTEAIASLKSGQQSASDLDLSLADLQFDEAKNNFVLAQNQIEELNFLTEEIILLLPSQSKSVAAGKALLEAGQIIAESGQILINGGAKFLNGNNLTDYYYSIAAFRGNLKEVIEKFAQAKSKIESISPQDLPAEHQATFNKILSVLPKVEKGLTDLYLINGAMLKILGHEHWQRYLVVFLNNNELRGSGGFMGSFGLLDIDRGEIKKLEIPGGGTYDLQGWLGPKVIAPEPLHLINSRWEFQDANWWADFPTSAKKIEWFYQNSNGLSVDGVITMTSTFIERLLKIVGPIPMEEYGRSAITAENFVEETQKIVQLEYDKETNKPKQFLADLAPKLLEKLFTTNQDNVKDLFELLRDSLNEKQLMMYFNDPVVENLMSDLGWSGALKETSGDYLSIIHTNIAGGKTDSVIKETIDHTAAVQTDGSIINTVKLIRRHTGIPGDNIFTGVQNNSYVRFYVPAGSRLVSAIGFKKPPADLFESPDPEYRNDFDLISIETDKTKDEATGTDIYKENGKTVFGNWLQLKAGEVQEVSITYILPFKLALEGENIFYYSLLAQKQPGSLGSPFSSYLKLNGKLKPLAKYPATLSSDNTGVSFTDILTVDKFYGVTLYEE